MSKKLISAVLVMAMIVSLVSTAFVTSVGAAAATTYTEDRNALLTALREFFVKGPTLNADTVAYLKSLGVLAWDGDNGRYVQEYQRGEFWKAYTGEDNKLTPDNSFFVRGTGDDLGKAFVEGFAVANVNVNGKVEWKTNKTGTTFSQLVTNNISQVVEYVASVWYFGQDPENTDVDPSFNTARNAAVKKATAMLASITAALKAEVKADVKPTSYDEVFNGSRYKSFASLSVAYNQSIGINPYFNAISDGNYFNDSYYKAVLGQYPVKWFTFDEIRAKAETKDLLFVFENALREMAINTGAGVLFYDFINDTYKPFNAKFDAICDALIGNVGDVLYNYTIDDQIKSFLKLSQAVALFDLYLKDVYNNIYTATNASLLSNVLYAKQIIEYVNAEDTKNRLFAIVMFDVDALTADIIKGIEATVPRSEQTLTATEVTNGTSIVKQAQALLDNWSHLSGQDNANGAAWRTLNSAKNNLKNMLPNVAGGSVVYIFAAGSAKMKNFANVEIASDKLTITFAPNYFAYIKYYAVLEQAIAAFTKQINAQTLGKIELGVSNRAALAKAINKYGFLVGIVGSMINTDNVNKDGFGINTGNFTASDKYSFYLFEDSMPMFDDDGVAIYKTILDYLAAVLDAGIDAAGSDKDVSSIYESVVGYVYENGLIGDVGVLPIHEHDLDLNIDVAIDSVYALMKVFLACVEYYISGGAEGGFEDSFALNWQEDTWTAKSGYEKAADALLAAVKGLTVDLTTKTATYDFILEKIATYFGLVEDDTPEPVTNDFTVINFENVTIQKNLALYNAIADYVDEALESFKKDNLKTLTKDDIVNYSFSYEGTTLSGSKTDKSYSYNYYLLSDWNNFVAGVKAYMKDALSLNANDEVYKNVVSVLDKVSFTTYAANDTVLTTKTTTITLDTEDCDGATELKHAKAIRQNRRWVAPAGVPANAVALNLSLEGYGYNQNWSIEQVIAAADFYYGRNYDSNTVFIYAVCNCGGDHIVEINEEDPTENNHSVGAVNIPADGKGIKTFSTGVKGLERDIRNLVFKTHENDIYVDNSYKVSQYVYDYDDVSVDYLDFIKTFAIYYLDTNLPDYAKISVNKEIITYLLANGSVDPDKIPKEVKTDLYYFTNKNYSDLMDDMINAVESIMYNYRFNNEAFEKAVLDAVQGTADGSAPTLGFEEIFGSLSQKTLKAFERMLSNGFKFPGINFPVPTAEDGILDAIEAIVKNVLNGIDFSNKISYTYEAYYNINGVLNTEDVDVKEATASLGDTLAVDTETFNKAIADVEAAISALDDKVVMKDARLYANPTLKMTTPTHMWKDVEDTYDYQVAGNYPTDFFKNFISAANALQRLLDENYDNRDNATYTRPTLTSLTTAFDKFITATKTLLTTEGAAALDRFIDKAYAVVVANYNPGGLFDFNDYELLKLKLLQSGLKIENYFPTRLECYYWFGFTLKHVAAGTKDEVANKYTFYNDKLEANLYNPMNSYLASLDVSGYSRAWATEYQNARSLGKAVLDVIDLNNSKVNSDMPLWYALRVLSNISAVYADREKNTVAAIEAYKADLNALLLEADTLNVYEFVTNTDEAKEIWAAFYEAFTAAQLVSLDARCSREDVDVALATLTAAMEDLAKITAPEGAATKETFEAKIAAAEALYARADVTTASTKLLLKEAIAAAKKVLQFNISVMNSTDIAAEIKTLDDAMKALVADMYVGANLKKEVRVLEMQVVVTLYTDLSYKQFRDAADAAYVLVEDDTKKESEYIAAYNKVLARFNDLKLAPVVEEEPEEVETPALVEEKKDSEVKKQAIEIYAEALAEYNNLGSDYTAESKAALKAAIDTLKADIDKDAADTKLLESIIAVKLARAALTIVVPETCDE